MNTRAPMWFLYSFGAALCFSSIHLALKYISAASPTYATVVFYIFFMATLASLAHVTYSGAPMALPRWVLWVLVIATIPNILGVHFQFRAITTAPNPGYAIAIVSTQGLVVFIASYMLFGAEFTATKALGVLSCFLGVALLAS